MRKRLRHNKTCQKTASLLGPRGPLAQAAHPLSTSNTPAGGIPGRYGPSALPGPQEMVA